MEISLKEYLEREGIGTKEVANFSSALNEINPKLLEELIAAEESDIMYNDGDASPVHDFLIKHGLLDLFNKVRLRSITKTIPIVLDLIKDDVRRVLDVGGFDGLKPVYYGLKKPDVQICSIDRNPKMLEIAKQRVQKYGCENVDFREMDFMHMDFPIGTKFDLAVALYVFQETFARMGSYCGSSSIPNNYFWEDKMRSLRDIVSSDGKVLVGMWSPEHSRDFIEGNLDASAQMVGLKLDKDFSFEYEKGEKVIHTIHSYKFV